MSMASRSSTGKAMQARAVYQDHAFQCVTAGMPREAVAGKAGLHGGPAHHGAKHGHASGLGITGLWYSASSGKSCERHHAAPMVLKNLK